MTASKLILLTGLGSCLIVVALAISALGVLPAAAPASHPSSSATSGSGKAGWSSNATYAVTFTETGLPSGTFWTVSLRGPPEHWFGPIAPQAVPLWGGGRFWNGSTSSTIGFELRNGTYNFSVGAAWNGSTLYAPSPAVGNFTVDGAAVGVSVTFAPVQFFTITFSETGLPSGTFWSVLLLGGGHRGSGGDQPQGPVFKGLRGVGWNGSTNSTVNFSRANGTYRYSIGPVWTSDGAYTAAPNRGNVTVDDANVTVQVVFAPIVFYNVTFNETGLPSGAFWSVGVRGSGFGWPLWNGSTSSDVNFTLANGTYHFRVFPGWADSGVYLPSPTTGDVTVDGASVTVNVTFSLSDTTSWGQTPAQN